MIVSIANPKGGVGKTTLAVNLATTLIAKFPNARILELDLQRSSSLWAGYRAQAGITPIIPVSTVSSIKEIPAVTSSYKADPKSFLVVDCGGIDSDYNRSAMSVSDLVVVPVRPSQVEVFALSRTSSVLKAVGKVGHVVNCGAFPASVSKVNDLMEFIRNTDGYKLLNTVVRFRADYQDAYAEGKSVIEYSKGSRAAGEILALTNEIRRLLKRRANG